MGDAYAASLWETVVGRYEGLRGRHGTGRMMNGEEPEGVGVGDWKVDGVSGVVGMRMAWIPYPYPIPYRRVVNGWSESGNPLSLEAVEDGSDGKEERYPYV